MDLYLTILTETRDFEDALIEFTQKFNKESQFVNVGIKTDDAWGTVFRIY